MKTRIVHVISGLLTGGAESMLYKLLRHMDAARFQHVVVSLADGVWPMTARIEALGAPVMSCGMRTGLPGPVAAANAIRLIRGLEPGLLQGWMYHGNLAAQIAAATLPDTVPVIWNVCATMSAVPKGKLATAMTIWLGARLSRWPDRIVSDSSASAQVHRDHWKFCNKRWEVIPNGFDSDLFQPSSEARSEIRAELGLADDALLIGLIGRYHPVKDHAGFLSAAALLRKRFPEAHFLLAGRGVHNSELMRQAAALGLSSAAHFLNERMDVPRLAASLDIAVSSSYSESLPTVIGEAMCCGVPCVVTNVGDSAWLVGDTGLVVSPQDPLALAQACGNLAGLGRGACRSLGLRARQRMMQKFSPGAFAARYEQVYDQALAGRRARGGSAKHAA